MNFLKQLLVLVTALIMAGHAYAEFYKYIDESGNILYTDDLSKVPLDQRKDVRQYKESGPVEKAAEQDAGDVSPETGEAAKPQASVSKEKARELTRQAKDLNARRETLDTEYNALIEERKKLEAEKDPAMSSEQIREYQKKIQQYNTRTKTYEEKREKLIEDVDAYNKSIEQDKTESKKAPNN